MTEKTECSHIHRRLAPVFSTDQWSFCLVCRVWLKKSMITGKETECLSLPQREFPVDWSPTE